MPEGGNLLRAEQGRTSVAKGKDDRKRRNPMHDLLLRPAGGILDL